ncbi:uncharacterized protein NPIL_395491 [Nephila pilipes]|uniref:Uncharacterized protein n=1 Tax=Nephila pilipes TaxID=299642 RepID=A0A8X6MJ78_NEPPI|nr:uncharacterized protein NPIL_395491 [Nephila pilipes]
MGVTKATISEKFKLVLKSLVEISFILLAINTVYTTIHSGVKYTIVYRVTTITVNTILLLVRVSLLVNKNKILKTLTKLHVFGKRHGKVRNLRNYVILTCGLCVLFPSSMSLYSIIFALNDIDRFMSMLQLIGKNSTVDSKVIFAIVMTGHQFIYSIHFLVFPGMVMTLLSFMYIFFVKVFRQRLEAIRFGLLQNVSRQEVSRIWNIFTVAKSIHQDIESAVSFTSFLAFVLTFVNILNVLSSILTKFLSDKDNLQYLFSCTIFSWTVLWFVVLTLSGTQVEKIEVFIKNIRQEVISKNFGKLSEGHNDLACLNLFNAFSDCKFQFTGWGIFEINKNLFFTISGILITYGVLFATEVVNIT